MRVRDWWDRASERDQDAVLVHLSEPRGWSEVPFAFLPQQIQVVLIRPVRINPSAFLRLDRRTYSEGEEEQP